MNLKFNFFAFTLHLQNTKYFQYSNDILLLVSVKTTVGKKHEAHFASNNQP